LTLAATAVTVGEIAIIATLTSLDNAVAAAGGLSHVEAPLLHVT